MCLQGSTLAIHIEDFTHDTRLDKFDKSKRVRLKSVLYLGIFEATIFESLHMGSDIFFL